MDLAGTVKNPDEDQSCESGLNGFDLVSDFVTIQASGGSDVFYKGSAMIREIKSGGSSSVVKKG